MRISNCRLTTIHPYAFHSMKSLRYIHFENIEQLQFKDHSLSWEGYLWSNYQSIPLLKITISNSTIDKISSYTFSGQIGEIKFDTVKIEHISSFAFSSLKGTETIEFDKTTFGKVEPQSFKKFDVENIIIQNCVFKVLPSRTFTDVLNTGNFKIENSKFENVKSGAFIINKPKHILIRNSYFEWLEADGFKIPTFGEIIINSNVFKKMDAGALYGISCLSTLGCPFSYENNIIHEASVSSLQINATNMLTKFSKNSLTTECDCVYIEDFLKQPYLKETSCEYRKGSFEMVQFKQEFCGRQSGSMRAVIISISILLVVVAIAVVVGICWYVKVYRPAQSEKRKDALLKNKIIQPDGRTYRETIVECVCKTDLLTTDL